ncbi:MAG: hypothetical protein ACK4Z5_03325 [Brevundimonas sp.]
MTRPEMNGPRLRAAVEALVTAGIDLLDAMDAAGIERECDEAEVISEDDGVVVGWREVGASR